MDTSPSLLLPALPPFIHSSPPPTFSSPSAHIPEAFVWPEALSEYNLKSSSSSSSSSSSNIMHEPFLLDEPHDIDLSCFRPRDPLSMLGASQKVLSAATTFGFFHVVNHGVPLSLIQTAHHHARRFFHLPFHHKQRVQRVAGDSFGYSSSFIGRFSSRLPWKETVSFQPSPVSNVNHYFAAALGEGHSESSAVYEAYCEAVTKVGLEIMELLEIGLSLESGAFTNLFKPCSSIMRLNYYPPCPQPYLTYGTGPHTDPTALTILHQDEVPGLQILSNDKWLTVMPRKDAFVVNIGDTLMALSNKEYKSCVHRAVVNSTTPRRSLTFFLNPGFDAIVRPPSQLISMDNPQHYHEFTWSQFLDFTQKVGRSGVNTVDVFNDWLAIRAQ